MALKNMLGIQSGTKKVLLVVSLITLGIILYAYLHYRQINRSFDPRVLEVRKSLKEYSLTIKGQKFDMALKMLDRFDAIYKAIPGYEKSFERGVFLVDKGSIYLVKAETELLGDSDAIVMDTIKLHLKFAKEYTEKGVSIYTTWRDTIGKKNDDEMRTYLSQYYKKEDSAFKGFNFDRIVNQRLKELKDAKVEIDRRLSVAYTNLGVVARYQKESEASKKYYEMALELWPGNLDAENNMRVLHGVETKKRSVIKQLFPEDRIKKAKENMKK